MGFFRRYKLTDYTADECRAQLSILERYFLEGKIKTPKGLVDDLETWACLRELLARHEKNNQSPLDEK
jgi:hypothetical protein